MFFLDKIEIQGNSTVKTEEILDYLAVSEGNPYAVSYLLDIELRLSKWGYFNSVNCEFTPVDENKVNLLIILSENKKVTDFKIYINKKIWNFKKKRFLIKENKAFNPAFLEKDIQSLSGEDYVTHIYSEFHDQPEGMGISVFIEKKGQISWEILVSNHLTLGFGVEIPMGMLSLTGGIFNQYFLDSENSAGIGIYQGIRFFENFSFFLQEIAYYSVSEPGGFSFMNYGLNTGFFLEWNYKNIHSWVLPFFSFQPDKNSKAFGQIFFLNWDTRTVGDFYLFFQSGMADTQFFSYQKKCDFVSGISLGNSVFYPIPYFIFNFSEVLFRGTELLGVSPDFNATKDSCLAGSIEYRMPLFDYLFIHFKLSLFMDLLYVQDELYAVFGSGFYMDIRMGNFLNIPIVFYCLSNSGFDSFAFYFEFLPIRYYY